MDVFGRPPTRAENIAGFIMSLLILVLLATMIWSATIIWRSCEREWKHNRNRIENHGRPIAEDPDREFYGDGE